jgi:hypothetical protein
VRAPGSKLNSNLGALNGLTALRFPVRYLLASRRSNTNGGVEAINSIAHKVPRRCLETDKTAYPKS